MFIHLYIEREILYNHVYTSLSLYIYIYTTIDDLGKVLLEPRRVELDDGRVDRHAGLHL